MTEYEVTSATEAARLLQSLRKTRLGGKKGGRPRNPDIGHTDSKGCRCLACRKAKGWSPYNKRVVVQGTQPSDSAIPGQDGEASKPAAVRVGKAGRVPRQMDEGQKLFDPELW